MLPLVPKEPYLMSVMHGISDPTYPTPSASYYILGKGARISAWDEYDENSFSPTLMTPFELTSAGTAIIIWPTISPSLALPIRFW